MKKKFNNANWMWIQRSIPLYIKLYIRKDNFSSSIEMLKLGTVTLKSLNQMKKNVGGRYR